MPNCLACVNSNTGINKNVDAGTSQVPEEGDPCSSVPECFNAGRSAGCRSADSSRISLDADAQICKYVGGDRYFPRFEIV
jgi:hypothetical protein